MKKILIAEDDQFLVNAYRVKLTKAGFDVNIARDGQEAIKTLATFTPDIILLDIIMPVKDGFTTLQEIKANPLWNKIPVIVASNLGQKEDLEKSKQLGAVDFIIKSDLSLENLIAKIHALIPDVPGAAAPTPAPAQPAAPTTTPVPTPPQPNPTTPTAPTPPATPTPDPSTTTT